MKRYSDEFRRNFIAQSSLPLITIVLPVYNSEDTIGLAIKSIEEQGYKNWELLIIDDGSSDKTLEKIKNLYHSNSRIIIYSNQKNSGVAYARNVGMYYAKGDYITFHDADDTSHPERLECQLYYLLKKGFRVVIPKYVRVNNKNIAYIINGKKKWNRVSGMMFQKELVDKIGYFKPTHISEDSEYHERILAVYGKRSRKIINKVLYYALFSPNSLLFSNANVEVNGNKINYKITNEHAAILDEYREEHKLIKSGRLNPYQSFEMDPDVTSAYNK